jgi:hypothetical protein
MLETLGGYMKAASELLDLESSLEDVVSDLVDGLTRKTNSRRKTAKSRSSKGHGTRQMQQTYVDLCQQSLNPVVRYMKAITCGVVTKDMVEVMGLIVAPLVNKTKQVGLDQYARKLRSLHIVLQEITRSKSSKITSSQEKSLEEVYWPVHEAFELEMRGHAVAVANMLAFFKKIKRSSKVSQVELKKLFAIGIPSLSMIRKSSIDELTSLTGIPYARMAVIRKIAREFQLVYVWA